MSTFYVLPPRQIVAERFGDFLKSMLPGADWQGDNLADALEDLLLSHPDVYVVWREDLPAGGRLMSLLPQAYGAEDGDEVVEVRHSRSGDWSSLCWTVLVDGADVA